MPRPNPCYHCTDRTTVCRLECERWAGYVKERDAAYEAAAKVRKANMD